MSLNPDLIVPAELWRVARRWSASINIAFRHWRQAVRLGRMLDRMEREAGPIPEDVQRHIDDLAWPE
jgi:hypothetical protein